MRLKGRFLRLNHFANAQSLRFFALEILRGYLSNLVISKKLWMKPNKEITPSGFNRLYCLYCKTKG